MQRSATIAIVISSFLIATVGSADAAIEAGNLSYLGSFELPHNIGEYNWGSLAYDNSGAQELVYWSSYSDIYSATIPTLLDATAVGHENLNVATPANGDASVKQDRMGGLRVRGTDLWSGGRNDYYQAPLDLSTTTNYGDNGGSCHGLSPVPQDVIDAVEAARGLATDALDGYDTLHVENYYVRPDFILANVDDGIPGVDGSVSQQAFFHTTGGATQNGDWHQLAYGVEWVSDPADSNYQEGRIVVAEVDQDDLTQGLAFYDLDSLLVYGTGTSGSAADPATVRTSEFDLEPYLSVNGAGNYHGVAAIAYDPVTKRLFVGEGSDDLGDGGAGGVVHVFSVPEPATMGLLTLGIAVMRLRRRRRRVM